MAGLSAAGALVDEGLRVLVLDKGRGVGGRLATRRLGTAVFDHGAQYFSVRSRGFASTVAAASEAGDVHVWSHGFPRLDAGGALELPGEGHPRWCGSTGMTALPKRLAAALDVRTATRVTAVAIHEGLVRLAIDGQPPLDARAAVLTAPVPQVLDLLDSGGVAINGDERARLEAIDYEPCFALMAVLAGPSRIPAPGGLSIDGGPISWLADNRQKGISPLPSITIHASPAWSREHFEDEPAAVSAGLLEAASPWIDGGPAGVVEQSLQRWKFARPTAMATSPLAVVSRGPCILVAGDAFAGPRVEGAVSSGMAAARWLTREWGGRQTP